MNFFIFLCKYSLTKIFISRKWLLTAAHCFVDGKNVNAYLGYYDLNINSVGSQIIEVAKYIPVTF